MVGRGRKREKITPAVAPPRCPGPLRGPPPIGRGAGRRARPRLPPGPAPAPAALRRLERGRGAAARPRRFGLLWFGLGEKGGVSWREGGVRSPAGDWRSFSRQPSRSLRQDGGAEFDPEPPEAQYLQLTCKKPRVRSLRARSPGFAVYVQEAQGLQFTCKKPRVRSLSTRSPGFAV
ncbi:hypothetical protein NN561_014543 [Cricetulus griseus]